MCIRDSYDADHVTWAASQPDPRTLYAAQRDILLNPNDPEIITQAKANGVPHSWIKAAQASPVWQLISRYQIALPLHPEYRTLPMVWYVPPLSPVVDAVSASGNDGEDHRVLLAAISQMRIPLEYLAGLFTAGATAPVELSLRRLAAMRSYMRDIFLGNEADETIPEAVDMTGEDIQSMYRLLSIAKYDDRYVIPTTCSGLPDGIADLGRCPVSGSLEAFHSISSPVSAPEGTPTLPLEVI